MTCPPPRSSASYRRQPIQARLCPGSAFAVLALVLFAFFFAASAPSPLFVVMQHDWGFSPSLLTVAFAVYAIALLASLLVAGSLSDHVGRRPVILARWCCRRWPWRCSCWQKASPG
jgi:MFS family permease